MMTHASFSFHIDDYAPPSLREQIIHGIYAYPDPKWDHVSAEAKDLLEWMLQVDIRRRATAEDCLADPWITVSYNPVFSNKVW